MRIDWRKLVSPRNLAITLIGAGVLFLAVFFAKDIANTFRAFFGKAAEGKQVGILAGEWVDKGSFQGTKMDENRYLVIDFNSPITPE